MKRIFSVFFCFLLSCVFLMGCAPKKTDSSDDDLLKEIDLTADESYIGNLKIRTASDASEIVIMNSLIEGFNKKYPNIRVSYDQQLMDSYIGTLTSDIGVAESTKDYSIVPDIFWLAQDHLSGLYKQKKVLFPISKIDEKDDTFSSDIFIDEMLRVASMDGQLYMLPRDYNQVVMYFNEEIFDAANVAYPTAQMSRQDFIKMLEDLRAGIKNSSAKNDYGVYYRELLDQYPLIDVNSQWDSWLWPYVKGFDAQVVDANGNAALESEEMYNAVAFWKMMREKNYVGPVQTSQDGVNFRMQQSAIWFHTRAQLTNIVSPADKKIKGVKKLGVTALPQFDKTYTIGGGCSGYAMYLNAENKTAAWLFLKYISSEEGQNVFCKTGNGIPSTKSLLFDESSEWRTFSSPNFGSAFDNDAFVYGLDFEEKPFATTRDFFQYLSIDIQSDVFTCLRQLFNTIDLPENSEKELREQMANQNTRINYYIERSKKK